MEQRTRNRFVRASLAISAAMLIATSCGSEDSGTNQAANVAPAASSENSAIDASMAPHDSAAGSMAADTKPADTKPADAMAADSMPGDSMPAWQTMQITDVSGATFRLSDFVGRPVFVENFATWCPTCRKQLGDTQKAAAQVGDKAVVIALSVETDLSADDVADYAKSNGFDDIRFAVMSPELLAAMVDAFGNSSVNPPSTPHVVIDATGVAGDMDTGRISVADLVAALDAAA
ncbi:MAG: TlpA disulfide reductase family protein [Acidimicrobiia bacterium]